MEKLKVENRKIENRSRSRFFIIFTVLLIDSGLCFPLTKEMNLIEKKSNMNGNKIKDFFLKTKQNHYDIKESKLRT